MLCLCGHVIAHPCSYLSHNMLSDTIPSQMGSLPFLHYLSMANNELEGPIPAFPGSFYRLTHIELSNNKLTGVIPTSIGVLTNLNAL
ncbi:unnamed protein product [Closterium sp. Naga37s-1]|nr:unnamed protein product [Closterium sp. Naga37s-1]